MQNFIFVSYFMVYILPVITGPNGISFPYKKKVEDMGTNCAGVRVVYLPI